MLSRYKICQKCGAELPIAEVTCKCGAVAPAGQIVHKTALWERILIWLTIGTVVGGYVAWKVAIAILGLIFVIALIVASFLIHPLLCLLVIVILVCLGSQQSK